MARPRKRLSVRGGREIMAILSGVETRVARKQMRSALKDAAKKIILPEAENRAPYDTGELASSGKVLAMKRSRSRFGYDVHFSRDVQQAVEQEFGNKRHRPDPFLRAAGYGNENRIRDMVVADLRKSIAELPVSPIR